MRIDFYYTNKRTNSLLRPDVDENQTVVTTFTDFHLKEQTSLNAPVFIIVAGNLPETNYCILSGTGATAERPDKYYYFVDHIEQYRKTVWHIHCTIDALATWKSQIKSQSAFVERSTNLFNLYLPDTTLPTENDVLRRRVYSHINDDFSASGLSGGCFIITLASTGDNVGGDGFGGVNHYVCSPHGCASILETLFQKPYGTEVTLTFGDMGSCVGGCYWLPLDYSEIGGNNVTSIYIAGTTISNLSGVKKLTKQFYDVSFPIAGTCTAYGDFRDYPPYRKYVAKLPWVGLVDLDGETISQQIKNTGGSFNWNVRWIMDFLSGVIEFIVYANSNVVGIFEASVKVDVPVSAHNPNIAGAIGGGVAKVGEVTGLWGQAWQGIKSGLGLIGDTVSRSMDSAGYHTGGVTSIIGGFSGSAIGMRDPETAVFEYVTNTCVSPSSIASVCGRPYNGYASLGSVSGFCKTRGFSVQGKMTFEEKQQIENAFNGIGVYDL